MAKGKTASFHVGTSGSGHHTEVMGDGRSLGGDGRDGPKGPNAGAGVEGRRVTPTWNRQGGAMSDGKRGGRGGQRYSEG